MRGPTIASMASVLTVIGVLMACTPRADGQAKDDPPSQVQSVSAGKINLHRLATLEFPWGMTWLPDKRLLITEKPGRLRIWSNGELSEPIEGVPKVVYRGTPSEQGGLLDVEADPDFAKNRYIYLSYSEAAEQQPSNIA